MDAVILCAAMLSVFPAYKGDDDGIERTCREVAWRAEDEGVPPALAVSLAWHESRFVVDAVSPAYASGPLQVLPKFWCQDYRRCLEGSRQRCDVELLACDFIEAGLRALRYNLARYDRQTPNKPSMALWSRQTLSAALCGYTGCKVQQWPGRTQKARDAFVDDILDKASWLKASVACRCSSFAPLR